LKKVLPKNAILIPDNAQCVFKGSIFEVYQWPQEMFDGTTKTFELLKRPDTVQVVAIKDGKIAMVHDEQPGRAVRVHFPGGRADETDVDWLAAAKRELLEETGLTFKNWKLVCVQQPVPKIEWFVPWFIATELESEQQQAVEEEGEKIEVELQDFAQVREAVVGGTESTLAYAMPLFGGVNSIAELESLPEFSGKETDR
jgi:ADP-ribose pyrophosphatase